MPEPFLKRRLCVSWAFLALLLGFVEMSSSAEDITKKGIAKARPKGVRPYLSNMLPGSRSIVSIKPEGTVVKVGELICELDSSALRDTLQNQRIEIEALEAEGRNYRLLAEAAELALEEQAAVLDQEMTGTEDDKGKVNTTSNRRVQSLRPFLEALEKARADHLASKGKIEAAKVGIGKLEAAIALCRIVAPNDGRVVHARWRSSPNTQEGYAALEAGVIVIENQPLLRIVPIRQPRSDSNGDSPKLKRRKTSQGKARSLGL